MLPNRLHLMRLTDIGVELEEGSSIVSIGRVAIVTHAATSAADAVVAHVAG